jgi:hypothetical protein
MTADIDAGFQGRVGSLPQHRAPLAERIEFLGMLSGRDVRVCDSNSEKTAAMLRMYPNRMCPPEFNSLRTVVKQSVKAADSMQAP